MKIGKVLLLSSFGLIAAGEILAVWPSLFYLSLFLADGIILAAVFLIARINNIKKTWINFLSLPLVFATGLIAYFSLWPQDFWVNKFFIQILLILLASFNFVYLKNLYYLWSKPNEPNNLFKISSAFSFLACFLFLAALYGFQLFLNLPSWGLILAGVIAIGFLAWQYFYSLNPGNTNNKVFAIILALLLGQLVWVFYLLPFDYNLLSLALSMFYYLGINISYFYLSGSLNKKNLRPLILFVLIILFLIFITAKWR